MKPDDRSFRFVPSRAEGLPGVSAVTVFPDRLEIERTCGRDVFRFERIASWPRPVWFWRLLKRLGVGRRFAPVADRHWHAGDKTACRFVFFTEPKLTIHMPADGPDGYGESDFVRVQQVIASGGFSTFDLN